MFKLTKKHKNAFDYKANAEFVREVAIYLRQNYSFTFESIPSKLFVLWIIQGVNRAREIGLTEEASIVCFLLLLRFHPEIDGDPAIRRFIVEAPEGSNENVLRLFDLLVRPEIFKS